MLQFKLVFAITCISWIQGSEGVSITVSENTESISSADVNNTSSCCVTGLCTCHSLSQALANISDHITINMLSDLELTSVVFIKSIENVTIIGHNNSVTCNNRGGIKFVSSSG